MNTDLYESTKVRKALAYTSGSADREGAIMDMAGYDEIEAVVMFAAIGASAVTAIKFEYGDESDLSDAEDATGATDAVADDDDDQVFRLSLVRPTKRYVRVVIDKDASHTTAECAIYRMAQPRNLPVTADVADEVSAVRVVGV